MKERKLNMVGVKLNDTQLLKIDKMIDEVIINNRTQSIQKLINQKAIIGEVK
ncbi:hypothetical protein [Pectobacterium polaris]|uniref:hypothetical protein n=1 Tax=Pectobacterium polaris TaxID=2042057 RepID=UPI002406AD6C|nr:hypothetical protein [Pectobacterium polaris]MDG0801083.1 hypothetical protein [Pectobacterium polaris]